jgi:large subunit ribosomal protein L25
MISEARILIGEERTESGTGAARALRRDQKVPAIIYGPGKETIAITLEAKDVLKYYKQPSFCSIAIDIQIKDVTHKVIPHAVQVHPVKDLIRHVDFIFLGDKTQNVKVPVIYKNKTTSLGVKRGGFFNIVSRKILLECPSNSIPKNIEIDVAGARMGRSIKAHQLKLPDGVRLVGSPDHILASITGRGRDDDADADEKKGPEDAKAKK